MKYAFLMILVGLITACATGPKPPTFTREYKAVKAKDFAYEDKNLSFSYTPTSFAPAITVKFFNKSEKPVKIIWDETTFINGDGSSEKVIHEGVRFLEKNSAMSPSIIPPGSTLNDILTPTSRIQWSGSGWDSSPICGQNELVPFRGYEEKDADCLGKTFGIFVTYEIDGKKSSFKVQYVFEKRTASETPKR